MVIKIEIPDDLFKTCKKASELILKKFPFINPIAASEAKVFEMVIVAELVKDTKNTTANLIAQKFVKSIYKTYGTSVDDDGDEAPQDDIDRAIDEIEAKKASKSS